MPNYKVFQCDSVNYELQVDKYVKTTFAMVTATYTLEMVCDWVNRFEAVYAEGEDAKDVELYRAELGQFYNGLKTDGAYVDASASASTGGDSPATQWVAILDAMISHGSAGAWGDDDETPTGGSSDWSLSQSSVRLQLVKDDMGYRSQIFSVKDASVNAANINGLSNLITYDATSTADEQQVRQIDRLGEIICNDRVRDILVQLAQHGCFNTLTENDGDDTNEGAGMNVKTINPLVNRSLQADDTYHGKEADHLLDTGDCLIFPVQLSKMYYGEHTLGTGAAAGDNDDNAAELDDGAIEVNIVFRQGAGAGMDSNEHDADAIAGIPDENRTHDATQ
jgi:hypothetical protein